MDGRKVPVGRGRCCEGPLGGPNKINGIAPLLISRNRGAMEGTLKLNPLELLIPTGIQ